jgi:hypothetical protein
VYILLWSITKHGRYRQFLFLIGRFLARLSGELLLPLSVRPLTFHILINSSEATNLNQTLVEWTLDGPLSKLCLVIPTSNQDGHQAKNRKKGG